MFDGVAESTAPASGCRRRARAHWRAYLGNREICIGVSSFLAAWGRSERAMFGPDLGEKFCFEVNGRAAISASGFEWEDLVLTSAFGEQYARNNKANGRKHLRCFPMCRENNTLATRVQPRSSSTTVARRANLSFF